MNPLKRVEEKDVTKVSQNYKWSKEMNETRKGNLLIVDDEDMILDRVEILLEDIADNIYTAVNGKIALEVLNTESIDCILCDINMPVMNGIELIKEVRAKNIETPFIFYTGHGSREHMMEVVKYGAFDFLNKPALDNLEDVVARGLAAGVGADAPADDDFVSEYQQLMEDLD